MILQTQRLYLRELEKSDYPTLRNTLQDERVMYAYEHAFTDAEVDDWYERQRARYKADGMGLWAVILKQANVMIGQCGLNVVEWAEKKILELAYLFAKEYWHQGYAIEAARGCERYAFDVLGADEVLCVIRENNIASQNVAYRGGMRIYGHFVKNYYNMDMPHYIFRITRHEFKNNSSARFLERLYAKI